MQKKIKNQTLAWGIGRMMVFLVFLVLTGCAMTLYGWKATETKIFYVSGVDYD